MSSEEEKRYDAEMGERGEYVVSLVRRVVHDLNNLLGPILGYPDLLIDELHLQGDSRDDLLEIKHLGQRAVDLLKDFQLLLRRESGGYGGSVPLMDAMGRACDQPPVSTLPAMQEGRVSLEFDDEAPEDDAPVSSPQILQGLGRLLVFAVSCAEAGGGGPLQVKKEAGGRLVLEMPGPPSTPEKWEQWLEPFTAYHEQGIGQTGLEAAVADQLIRDEGGALAIQAPETGRYRVTVDLPAGG